MHNKPQKQQHFPSVFQHQLLPKNITDLQKLPISLPALLSPCFSASTADAQRADGDVHNFGWSWIISTIFVSIIIYITLSLIIDAHRARLLLMDGHKRRPILIDGFGHHCRVKLGGQDLPDLAGYVEGYQFLREIHLPIGNIFD